MATTGIFVKYDTTTLSPTPLVNYSHHPIDYGYIYGYNTDIALDGLYTGISTTGVAISFLTGTFANQFKELLVTDDLGNELYRWSGVTVESIAFDTNPYYIGSFVRYSIKLKAYNLPSGVLEPSNEYSFTQNEDSTVNVSHKISARGVRNSFGAFDNAIAFVQQFTGKNPYDNCIPFFVPSGSGILMSLSETINRAEAIYSVNEVYKYNTGSSTPYIKNTSLDVGENLDGEYRTIDYSLKLQGSPILKNASSIIDNYLNYPVLTDIQNEFGLTSTSWIKNSYSANVDSGSSMIDIKIGYLSGASLSGFFDYNVSCEIDSLMGTEQWKIDGEFKCFGPLDYRKKELANFRENHIGNEWEPFLTGLVFNSPIFTGGLHSAEKMFSPNIKLNVVENPNLAMLKMSAVIEDGYEPDGIADLKYSWEVSPSKWIYKLMPSATIEGSYVMQDLQAKTQTRQKMSFSSKANDLGIGLSGVSNYLKEFAGCYVLSGNQDNVTAFLLEDILSTGTYDVNASNTWLGMDSGISSGSLALQSIGSFNDIAPLRTKGFNFGY